MNLENLPKHILIGSLHNAPALAGCTENWWVGRPASCKLALPPENYPDTFQLGDCTQELCQKKYAVDADLMELLVFKCLCEQQSYYHMAGKGLIRALQDPRSWFELERT